MGSGYSQEEYDAMSFEFYQSALHQTCLLPDVGIDEALLKFSGTDSNYALQVTSNQLLATVPGYVEKFGMALAGLRMIPNSVGLGALVLSLIMDICVKTSTPSSDSYTMLRRVFGEEKASSVRDVIQEYLKRHRMFINNEIQLEQEIGRLEQQLSNHLTRLRNSMLHDSQMSSRSFKIWVNGASFHVQMLIHRNRLRYMYDVSAINTAIDVYLQDLDRLLNTYKSYFKSKIRIEPHMYLFCTYFGCTQTMCQMDNLENGCVQVHGGRFSEHCGNPGLKENYINTIFTRHEPITNLRSHFSNMKMNLYTLCQQHDAFTLPSSTNAWSYWSG